MCEHILGIEPAGEDEKPKPRRTQADKWALNYTAARQFYERDGHLRVPRKHIETIVGDGKGGSGEHQEERQLRLGAWIGNQRSRAATLSPERIEQLSANRNALGVAAYGQTVGVALPHRSVPQEEDEQPPMRRTQSDRYALNHAAGRTA